MKTPNLPISALDAFGPDVSPSGDWGRVAWEDGTVAAEHFDGLWHGSLTTFPAHPGIALMYTSDADVDTDGPGGNNTIDPWYERHTSLRYRDGSSCDSRTFPGVVMPPALKKFGVRLGDFCLVSWRGAIRSAQVYDIGPARKIGEFSIRLIRELGLIGPDVSDHHAATLGTDATDVVTLIFPGSGPGRAVAQAEIVESTHRHWKQFTGRPLTPAPEAVAETAPVTAPGGTASGSVGVAVPLALSAISTFIAILMPLSDAPSPSLQEIGAMVQMLAYGVMIIGGGLGIAVAIKTLRHRAAPAVPINQPFKIELAEEYTTRKDFDAAIASKKERLDKVERDIANVREVQTKMREDVRHDIRNELTPVTLKIEERSQDAEEQFRTLAGEIGALKNASGTAAAAQADNRRILDTILQRLPRAGGAQA